MKQPLNKRELVIAAIGVMVIIVAGIYTIILYKDLQSKDRLLEGKSALLKEKEADANETASYIETICAEYRKLYQSYREVRYSDPASVDKYISLPGSAKGQIDECYLPD